MNEAEICDKLFTPSGLYLWGYCFFCVAFSKDRKALVTASMEDFHPQTPWKMRRNLCLRALKFYHLMNQLQSACKCAELEKDFVLF